MKEENIVECTCKCHELKVSGGLRLRCEKCGSVYLGDGEYFHHEETLKKFIKNKKVKSPSFLGGKGCMRQ
jgi:hypothetical protein